MSGALTENVSPQSPERTRSPFLRQVYVKGYKSLADCAVTLEPLTIFVGRNAAGKSNFLDALAFLRDLMDLRVTQAVNQRKGWSAILCRSSSEPVIEMGFLASVEVEQSSWEAAYSFSLGLSEHNQIVVREEQLELVESEGDRYARYHLAEDGIQWSTHDDHVPDLFPEMSARAVSRPNQPDRLVLSRLGVDPFLTLAEGLRASCAYNFYPLEIRNHQPLSSGPILMRDGRNLARALEALREIEPETIARIAQYLRTIVPGVLGFRAHTYGDFETVRFTIEGKPGTKTVEFDASGMSDGALRVLASLVAAFQIVLPQGYPGFIGIEEPETALHPAATRALIDALDEATLRTQILLTTHSTEILDNPTIQPENVRVVQMVDGETRIGKLDEASTEIVRRKLDTLGGLERQNQLEPELEAMNEHSNLSDNNQEQTT